MRRAQLQAVALRAIAERGESGVSPKLADALANEWHVRELERCDREDSGGEPWDVVRARILARPQRRSA